MPIHIPLTIQKGQLKEADTIKLSIDSNIELIMTTPRGGFVSDPDFGFVFNNLKFEIFDENEGVVLNSDVEHPSFLYEKKVSGSSRNVNTFAIDLKQQIERYEPRLSDVSVTMSYIREHRKIYIIVKGIVVGTQMNYQYQTTLSVWNC